MHFTRTLCGLAFALVAASPANGQIIHCIDPPVVTPTESACRIAVEAGTRELLLVLQLRGDDDKPMRGVTLGFEATSGLVPNSAMTDPGGYVSVKWRGPVQDDPVIVTATASPSGLGTRRQVRISRREPPGPPPFITKVAPDGYHSAFAGKYLNSDIEVEIEADAVRCIRTTVFVEYLSVGTGGTPEPKRVEVPALWSEKDNNTFGCTAQLKWVLSPAVGNQELRTWIKRDSSFVLPPDQAGAQRYLRPHVVHAVAHAQPAFLAGAALVDSTKGSSVPRIIGVDLSFPTVADFLKHHGPNGAGEFVDHVRIFVGTNFNTSPEIRQNVYLGIEPVVLLIGPRAADLPVALAAGRRLGEGDNSWFFAALINAGQVFQIVAKGLGF
jgi:hypothetical protein